MDETQIILQLQYTPNNQIGLDSGVQADIKELYLIKTRFAAVAAPVVHFNFFWLFYPLLLLIRPSPFYLYLLLILVAPLFIYSQ